MESSIFNDFLQTSDFMDSEEEEQDNVYKRKYYTLKKRIEDVRRENERIVNRIHHVKRLKHRNRKLRKYLITSLKSKNVDIENLPLPSGLQISISTLPVPTISGSSNTLLQSHTTVQSAIPRSNLSTGAAKTMRNNKLNKSKAFLAFCDDMREQVTLDMQHMLKKKCHPEDIDNKLAAMYKALPSQDKRRYQNSTKRSTH